MYVNEEMDIILQFVEKYNNKEYNDYCSDLYHMQLFLFNK
jgi:hypothetical protein